jgi:Uma2 family endonuclease
MSTFVVYDESVHIPEGVECSLEAFRQWAHSPEFPKSGRICYLNGEVWVDMSKEQVFSHNQVKQEYNLVIGRLVKVGRLGRYVPDGMLLSNLDANLAVLPDATFVSFKSLRSGRVRLVEGIHEGYLELEGTPDMALEVVSTSSVGKDSEILMDLYWQAGIAEYWLVDVRKDRLSFEIYRHAPKGFVVARKQAAWVRSKVFSKSFRLTRQDDELGNPEFTLEVR